MKLNCADFASKNPTPELIFELVRDNAKRGEFMILEDDSGAFVQIAGDYDEANPDARVFTLEYRETGKDAPLFHAVQDATAAEVTEAFVAELTGDRSWRNRHTWEQTNLSGSGTPIKIALFVAAAIGVFAAIGKFVLKIF